MQVTGKVYNIGAVTSKEHNGKTYKERQLVIQVDEQYNGQTYSQYIPVIGKRDAIVGYMDNLKVGQEVTAHCNLRGVKYMKDGAERFFGSIEVYKVEAVTTAASAPVQAAPQHDTKIYTSAPSPAPVDDLPF